MDLGDRVVIAFHYIPLNKLQRNIKGKRGRRINDFAAHLRIPCPASKIRKAIKSTVGTEKNRDISSPDFTFPQPLSLSSFLWHTMWQRE
jgi:hypothetical protein